MRFEVDDQVALWQTLDDVFATRAPATLAKRGRALTSICDGLEEAGHSFPLGERIFYDLLCQHRSRGAPASRLSGFVEGVFLPDETRGGRLRMTAMPASSLPEAATVAAWNVKKEIILVSDDEAADEAFLEEEWASDQSGHVTTDSDTSSEEERGATRLFVASAGEARAKP